MDSHPVSVLVADYYGHSELYAFMPRAMFDALEAAFLSGSASASVSAADLAVLRRAMEGAAS